MEANVLSSIRRVMKRGLVVVHSRPSGEGRFMELCGRGGASLPRHVRSGFAHGCEQLGRGYEGYRAGVVVGVVAPLDRLGAHWRQGSGSGAEEHRAQPDRR